MTAPVEYDDIDDVPADGFTLRMLTALGIALAFGFVLGVCCALWWALVTMAEL